MSEVKPPTKTKYRIAAVLFVFQWLMYAITKHPVYGFCSVLIAIFAFWAYYDYDVRYFRMESMYFTKKLLETYNNLMMEGQK